MAHDPELVERIHALLAGEPSLEPKRMFGGVGFMVEGSLTVAAMSGGGLLARVGRESLPELIGPGVEQMEMGHSPTPTTDSSTNCPGRCRQPAEIAGSTNRSW